MSLKNIFKKLSVRLRRREKSYVSDMNVEHKVEIIPIQSDSISNLLDTNIVLVSYLIIFNTIDTYKKYDLLFIFQGLADITWFYSANECFAIVTADIRKLDFILMEYLNDENDHYPITTQIVNEIIGDPRIFTRMKDIYMSDTIAKSVGYDMYLSPSVRPDPEWFITVHGLYPNISDIMQIIDPNLDEITIAKRDVIRQLMSVPYVYLTMDPKKLEGMYSTYIKFKDRLSDASIRTVTTDEYIWMIIPIRSFCYIFNNFKEFNGVRFELKKIMSSESLEKFIVLYNDERLNLLDLICTMTDVEGDIPRCFLPNINNITMWKNADLDSMLEEGYTYDDIVDEVIEKIVLTEEFIEEE